MPQDRYNGRGSGRTGRPARGGSSRDARRSPQGGRTRRAASSRASERRGADAPSGRLSTELVSRHGLLAGGFLAASAIVLARLSEIQVFNTDWYREQANARRVSSQTLYAKRGTIYDRNGTVLVSSIECKNVYLNPSLIKKKQRRRAIDALVDVLGMDEDVVEDLVDREGTFVYVKRQVDEEDAELLAKKGIAGIEFEPAIKRVYPNGSLASQVLGVVNVDNEGITGLEKQYNEVLTGVNGSLMRERARDGSFIAGGAYEKVPAQDGMDIVLGIDANVQRVAEDAIAEAVERVGATYGSIIVTDPTTGEIIAACSYPTYDPTDLASASNASMNLRVVTDVYEPGSVFKTFVSAAAIEHKGLTPRRWCVRESPGPRRHGHRARYRRQRAASRRGRHRRGGRACGSHVRVDHRDGPHDRRDHRRVLLSDLRPHGSGVRFQRFHEPARRDRRLRARFGLQDLCLRRGYRAQGTDARHDVRCPRRGPCGQRYRSRCR